MLGGKVVYSIHKIESLKSELSEIEDIFQFEKS